MIHTSIIVYLHEGTNTAMLQLVLEVQTSIPEEL